MKKIKGFTLVELLAVIVILAVILIIAMPRISDVISNSKKASLEATAKTVASQAEKKLMEKEILEDISSISCSDIVKLNDSDYGACTITFDGNKAKVNITGKGKFDGLKVVNATKDSAVAVEDKIEYTDANCFVVSNGVITDYKNPTTALNIIMDALVEKVYAGPFIPSTSTDRTYDSDKCPRDVVIPEKINGVTITGIGHHAFAMDDIHTLDIPATVTNLADAMFKYKESNKNFTTIYIHDEAQKDLNWTYFVYYNGDGDGDSAYNKETGVVSSASGDIKVVLR